MIKEIRLDGVIGDWGATSEEFNFKLDELDLQAGDELLVKINSVGGSVIEGWGIYNTLISLDNKVTTRGEGIVASIASLILMAGTVVEMSEVGALMIHRASNHVHGNAEDLEKAAEILKTIDETLLTVYNAVTNDDVTEEMMIEWLDKETWFSPSEAMEHGFIHEVVNKVETTVSAIYKPKKLSAMSTISESLEKLINQISGKDDEKAKAEEALLKAEKEKEAKAEADKIAAKKLEDDAEAKKIADDAAAKAKAEEDAKPEVLTKEQGDAILNGLMEITKRLEAIEKPEKSVEQVVEDQIITLAKGIKSTGSALAANGNLNGTGDPKWEMKHQNIHDQLDKIGEKTKIDFKM